MFSRVQVLVLAIAFALGLTGLTHAGQAKPEKEDAGKLRISKVNPPWLQFVTPTELFDVETDVSKEYLTKLSQLIYTTEQRMCNVFRITPGFVKGNDPTSKLAKGFPINGDLLSKWGYRPWIEVKIFKTYEDYADNYFEENAHLYKLINKKELPKETTEQRAIRRMTEGVPGAYYMRTHDYDEKFAMRLIRGYLGNKTPDELEGDLLHELGHLFLETFLFEFAGAPKEGNEAEKRGTPAWIGEGCAQLFEVNWSNSKESLKKKKRYNAMIYEAVKANDSYPFAEFINVTNAHNLKAVSGDFMKATINYAQSYSVINYMMEKDWQRFLAFLENLRSMHLKKMMAARGAIVTELYSIQDQAFRDSFGIPLVDLETYWKKYVIEQTEKDLKKDPSGYYWCGEYLFRRKDYDKAAERFKLAIEGAPKSGDGYLGLGRVLLTKGDNASALENLKKAVEFSPDEEDNHYYLGIAQSRNGLYKESIASLEKSVKLFPLFHQAWAQLGNSYFGAREFKKSADAYGRAFEIERNNPVYLMSKGRAEYFGHDYSHAQSDFSAFSRIFQKEADGYFWYGMAAWRLNDQKTAEEKFAMAVKLQPNVALYSEAAKRMKAGQAMRFDGEEEDKPVQVASADGKKDEKQAVGGNPFANPANADEKESAKKKDAIKISLPELKDEE